MKKLLTILLIATIFSSCSSSQKTANGQTIVANGKHSRIVLGNPRRYAEKQRKTENSVSQ